METQVKTDIRLKQAAGIDTGATVARLNAMKIQFEDLATDGVRDVLKKPAPAYERLHAMSVRRRVEDVNLPSPNQTPFSQYPASPKHTAGLGLGNR